jgi:hypothetical protein
VTVALRWIITGIPMSVYTGSILKPPRSIHWGDDGGGNGPLAFGLVLRHEAACAKPPPKRDPIRVGFLTPHSERPRGPLT